MQRLASHFAVMLSSAHVGWLYDQLGGIQTPPPPQPDKCACSTAPNETAKWSFLKIFNESLVPFQLKPYLMTNKRNMLI